MGCLDTRMPLFLHKYTYECQFLRHRKLQLVDYILYLYTIMSNYECPQDWLYLSSHQTGLCIATQHCPIRPYVSLHIRIPTKSTQSSFDASGQSDVLDYVVRRITFTTVSHDQGYSESGGGTYDHSHTWVCAST